MRAMTETAPLDDALLVLWTTAERETALNSETIKTPLRPRPSWGEPGTWRTRPGRKW